VANQVDPEMSCVEENLATLEALLRAPLLGRIPWLAAPDPAQVANRLDLDRLLNG
jgi:dethiobiotin synthetase